MSILHWLLVERQKVFDAGVRAFPKILEVYMSEAVWPQNPAEAK